MKKHLKRLLPIVSIVGLVVALVTGCASTHNANPSADTAREHDHTNMPTTTALAETQSRLFHAVQRCTQPHGSLRVMVDTNANWYQTLTANTLDSPKAVLETIVKQSGCYTIASAAIPPTHTLAPTAKLDKETPSPFTIGFGSWGRHIGIGVQTRLRSTKASTTLAIMPTAKPATPIATDAHASITAEGKDNSNANNTVLTATGEADKTNLGFFTGASGHSGAVSVHTAPTGGYLKTREGKLVTTAFIDAFNQLVKQLNQTKTSDSHGHAN